MSSLEDVVRAGLSGRYEIEAELGRGGMAVVFLATDVKHGRKVAIKVLAPGVATGTGAERFQREIRSVAGLSHPHILPVLDSGELAGAESRAWYAMPHVASGSLRDRLQREGPLPVADAVRIAAEVAEALDHAHRQGLVHRDIKPENVLLQDGQAVLSDFGIAGMADAAPEDRLTATGLVMGTARYMSPEQVTGSESIDGRTDIYSLGCVLYETLTGQPPFDASSRQRILARLVSEEPPPVSRDRSAAAGLDPVLSKALARIPGDRYGTAGEFAEALRASTAAQGLAVAHPPGAMRRPGIFGGGWRRVGVAGAVAIAALTAVVVADRRGTVSVEPSLAVLPFDNLSPDPDDAYFADGVREEIRTQLSKVDGIRLIVGSRAPGQEERSITELASEWGATAVLGGSIRRAGEEIRMSFRLIDPKGNDALWAGSYDPQLADIFETQTEVASQVVQEIRGALTAVERAELMRPSPNNDEALIPYYAGQASFRDFLFSADGVRRAAAGFGRAVELDPGFVEAWTGLVQAHLFLAWLWGVPDSRGEAQRALDRLRELAPGTMQLRLANGLWLYLAEQRFTEALAELEVVAGEWPEDVNVMIWLGAAQRRAGDLEQGLRTWERALERDPTNASMASNISQLLQRLGRSAEAERYARRSVELNPDVPVHWWEWLNSLLLRADTAAARVVVDSAVQHLGREGLESDGWWVRWQIYSGNLAEVQDVYRDVYARDPRSLDGTWGGAYDLGIAAVAATGDAETVHTFAQSMKARCQEALSAVAQDDLRSRSDLLGKLALAEAYLGNEESAVRLAHEAVDVYAATGDPLGNNGELRLAQVYAVVGRPDEAVEQLRDLLSGSFTVELVRISPLWHPLADHPGFQALLAGGG